MLERPAKTINLPDDDHVEFSPPRIGHQPIERRSRFLDARGAIHLLPDDVPAASGGVLPQPIQLHIWTLTQEGRHTRIGPHWFIYHSRAPYSVVRPEFPSVGAT